MSNRVLSICFALVVALSFTACGTSGSGRTETHRASDTKRTSTRRTGKSFSPEGPWVGVFLNSFRPVRIDVDFKSPKSGENGVQRLDGTARFRTLFGGSAGGSGTTTARMDYDPRTQSFSMSFGRVMGGMTGDAGQFRSGMGIADMESESLAGSIRPAGGRPLYSLVQCFYFVRPGVFGSMEGLHERFHGPPPRISPAPQKKSGFDFLGSLTGGSKPSRTTVVDWAAPLFREHPEVEGLRVAHGPLEVMAIGLFEDDHFRRAFGDPFDELSEGEIDGIYAVLLQDLWHSRDAREKAVGSLSAMFRRTDQGSPTGAETVQGLIAFRVAEAWTENQVVRLGRLKHGESSWQTIAALEARSDGFERQLLGSDHDEEIRRAIEGAITRLAYARLDEELDALLAEPVSREKMVKLLRWSLDHTKLIGRTTRYQQSGLERRVQSGVNQAVALLLPPVRREIESLGTGLPAVLAGNRWFAAFEKDYWRIEDRKEYESVRNAFLARRGGDLNSAREEMLRKVHTIPAVQMDTLTRLWFLVPGDEESPVFAAVEEAKAARRKRIARAIVRVAAEAKKLARADPGRPLPYIDFRRYPGREFLEFIYYGSLDTLGPAEVLATLTKGTAADLLESIQYVRTLSDGFQGYHDLYYQRYGPTESMREASGEDWEPVVIVTEEVDFYGNRREVGRRTRCHVRRPFWHAYGRTIPSGEDIIVGLVGGLIADSEARRKGVEGSDIAVLGDLFPNSDQFRQSFEMFLDEFKEDYPATVRHFEQNLLRAMDGEPLVAIDRLPIE